MHASNSILIMLLLSLNLFYVLFERILYSAKVKNAFSHCSLFYCFFCCKNQANIIKSLSNGSFLLLFTEKLRRKDAEVAKALEEKERLIADILHIPPPSSSSSSSTILDVYARSAGRCSDEIDDMRLSDALNQSSITDKDATKVLLAALEQGELRTVDKHDHYHNFPLL